jgi:MFS family permease
VGAVSGARLAVTVAFLAHGGLFGTWVSRIPAVQNDLGLTEGELGIALFIGALGTLTLLPVAGWSVSRAGSRPVMTVSLPACAATLPLLALAPALPALALGLFAFAATSALLDVAMNAHGLQVERQRGRPLLSSFHAAWSFGGLVAAAIGGLVAAAGIGPVPHFVVVALVLGAAGVVTSRLLLPTDVDRPEVPVGFRRPPRALAVLALLAFCGLVAEGAAADWSAVYLSGSLGSGPGVAALGFATFSLTMATVRLAGDRLTERWGPSALTRRGGILAGAGLAGALVIGMPWAALVGFACMGAGLAAVVPLVFRAAGSMPGFPAGAGIAAVTTVGYAGFLVGPPVIGGVAELVGLPLALGLVVAMLGVLVLLAGRTETEGAPGPVVFEPAPEVFR